MVATTGGGEDVYGPVGGYYEDCVGRLGFRVRFALIPNKNKKKA